MCGCSNRKLHGEIPSLAKTSIKVILKDHGETRKSLKLIPKDLFEMFLVSALENERTLCIMEIVSQWPYRLLNLRSLLPQRSNVSCPICSTDDPTDYKSLCLMIAKGFSEQVRKNGRLKVVDISGIGTLWKNNDSDEHFVVNFLQNFQTDQHSLNVSGQNESGPRNMIFMDLVVGERNCRDLLKLLMPSIPTAVQIKCRTLILRINWINSVRNILANVEPQTINTLHFVGSALPKNGSDLTILVRFTAVSSLNFGQCSPHYLFNSIIDTDLFSKFPNLVHLDLSYNCVRGRLRSLLQNVRKPLSTLNMEYCRLNENDISYLANSHHATQLQTLSLRCNHKIAKDPQMLFKLLTSCGDTLKSCCLSQTSLGKIAGIGLKLAQVSHSMKSLTVSNLRDNLFTAADQAKIVTSFGLNVPTLKILLLHVPLDISYPEDHADDADIEFEGLCIPADETGRTFSTKDSDLDRLLQICVECFHGHVAFEGNRELHVVFKIPWLSLADDSHCFHFKR